MTRPFRQRPEVFVILFQYRHSFNGIGNQYLCLMLTYLESIRDVILFPRPKPKRF